MIAVLNNVDRLDSNDVPELKEYIVWKEGNGVRFNSEKIRKFFKS